MIPKTIHYCWFGRNPKPKLAEKCIKSWKKYCPDYEIIEWNEDNYDVTKIPYMKEAYEAKKWGFVPDYARLDIIYQYGGIYLDTDVELIKPIDDLLKYKGFAGFERGKYVALGLGFGAEAGCQALKSLMDAYQEEHFQNSDGTLNLIPAPVRDTDVFAKKGLVLNDSLQTIDGMTVFPTEYFCPLAGGYEMKKTKNTFSVHWYSGSWLPEQEVAQREAWLNSYKSNQRMIKLKSTAKRIMGARLYQIAKRILGRK